MESSLGSWSKIVISGLVSREGGAYNIIIGAPQESDGTFQCRVNIPTVVDREIYGENALSTLISALRVVEAQIYEPSAALISATTLTDDDYPDVYIQILGATVK